MTYEVKTPTRLSLFGGGSDLPIFSDKYGGAVVSLAINLYQRINATFSTHKSITFPENGSIKFYSTFINETELPDMQYDFTFDGKIHSGVGSSASCGVGIVALANQINKWHMTKFDIAKLAWEIEVNRVGLYGGKQDQYAASLGGFNLLEFNTNRVVRSQIKNTKIIDSIVLFDTGLRRNDTKVQEGFKNLKDIQIKTLQKIKDMAYDSLEYIETNDIEVLGEMLNTAWELKKKSNKVTNKGIDNLYKKAIELGALGGKLMGSGGGGYMFFLVEPNTKEQFISKITNILGLKHIPFELDTRGVVVKIIRES